MNISVNLILLSIIIMGYSLSIFIFLFYYYIYNKKDDNIRLYIIGKILQTIPWLVFLIWPKTLTDWRFVIANALLIIGGSIEVYCLIAVGFKNNIKLFKQLIIFSLLSIIAFAFTFHDISLRNIVISIVTAILFSFLFFWLTLKQRTSKMQLLIGWSGFIFAIFNIIRAVNAYLVDIELILFQSAIIQIIVGFIWITIAYTFPLLFLFILKEKDNLKLENYKNTLESKVKLRTQELEDSLEREKELGVLKTSFVSMASHEFRTPLTAINAITDVLKRYKDTLSPEDIEQRLDKIKSEVKDMTSMLEDILIIGKSDSQKLQFNPVEFNFLEHLNTVVSEYQLSLPTERTISISNPENNVIMVNADPKWTKHIIVNLLSNALKYSANDKPIEIVVTPKKNELQFSFKDYGIGIPKEDLDKLFEPFHRAKNAENISGTGLGMAVVQKAVELHGGSIDVKSEVGVGTTFTVSLPQ